MTRNWNVMQTILNGKNWNYRPTLRETLALHWYFMVLEIVLNNDDKKITDAGQSLLSLPNQVQSELKPAGGSSADPLCLVFTRTSTNAAWASENTCNVISIRTRRTKMFVLVVLVSQFSLTRTEATQAQAQGCQPFRLPSCLTSRGELVSRIPSRNGFLHVPLSLWLCSYILGDQEGIFVGEIQMLLELVR